VEEPNPPPLNQSAVPFVPSLQVEEPNPPPLKPSSPPHTPQTKLWEKGWAETFEESQEEEEKGILNTTRTLFPKTDLLTEILLTFIPERKAQIVDYQNIKCWLLCPNCTEGRQLCSICKDNFEGSVRVIRLIHKQGYDFDKDGIIFVVKDFGTDLAKRVTKSFPIIIVVALPICVQHTYRLENNKYKKVCCGERDDLLTMLISKRLAARGIDAKVHSRDNYNNVVQMQQDTNECQVKVFYAGKEVVWHNEMPFKKYNDSLRDIVLAAEDIPRSNRLCPSYWAKIGLIRQQRQQQQKRASSASQPVDVRS
jgi:hypothetical protein